MKSRKCPDELPLWTQAGEVHPVEYTSMAKNDIIDTDVVGSLAGRT